jgi:hypothetical protein
MHFSDSKSDNDRAMAQVVSRRPLTAEARVRARVNPCQYHSTVALQTHIIWGMRDIANVSRHPRLGLTHPTFSSKAVLYLLWILLFCVFKEPDRTLHLHLHTTVSP